MEVITVFESISFKGSNIHLLINLHAILLTFPHSNYLALQQNEQKILTSVNNISTKIIQTTLSTTTIQLTTTTTTKKQRMSILLC
jgi:hypothetical protein